MQSDSGDGNDQALTPADVIAVLRSYDGDEDREQLARFDAELVGLAERDAEQTGATAADVLGSTSDPRLSTAAIYALGRAAEMADLRLVNRIEASILDHVRTYDEPAEGEAVAIALLHVWSRTHDESFARQRRFATDGHPSLRRAAAMFLALATEMPLPAFVIPTVRQLAEDPDPGVPGLGPRGALVRGWLAGVSEKTKRVDGTMRWGGLHGKRRKGPLVLLAMLLLPVLLVVGVVPGTMVTNNLRLNRWTTGLFGLTPPAGSRVVQRRTDIGLLGGNGNHCDRKAWVILATSSSTDEVQHYYASRLQTPSVWITTSAIDASQMWT